MDNRVLRLNKRKKLIVSICKKMQWLFFAIFAIYLIIVGIIAFYAMSLPNGFQFVGSSSLVSLIPIICNTAACGFVILILGIIFREIGKEASPFTFKIAKFIDVLAVILLVSFLSGFFIQPGSQVGAVSDSAMMAVDYDGNPVNVINVEISSLIASIVCFAMSAVFRYGAILQIETDDLV